MRNLRSTTREKAATRTQQSQKETNKILFLKKRKRQLSTEELPTSEVRGRGLECQAATGQERPRRATPRPRSGAAAERRHPASEVTAAAGRSYPVSEASGDREETAGIGGQGRPG